MISMDQDKKALLNAYGDYRKCCGNGKVYDGKTPFEISSEVYGKAEIAIMDLTNPCVLEKDKERILKRTKDDYVRYCRSKKPGTACTNTQIEERIKLLIETMAEYEAKIIQQIRRSVTGADDIPLSGYFGSDQAVRSLCLPSFHANIREFFITGGKKQTVTTTKKKKKKNKNTAEISLSNVLSEVGNVIYITKNGARYHRIDCPYCQRSNYSEVTLEMALKMGYTACRCLKDSMGLEGKLTLSKAEQKKVTDQVLTAFVDESCRINPWYKYDKAMRKEQLSYSYIICKGWLNSETEIKTSNTLYEHADITDQYSNKTQEGTYEAIKRVMIYCAFDVDFHGDLLIYTDNLGALHHWHTFKGNDKLARMFNSVKVSFVPRSWNTTADKIGRKRVFIDAPKSTFDLVEDMLMEGKRDTEELRFVNKFFSDPKHDIPDLINALGELAGRATGSEKASSAYYSNPEGYSALIPELLEIISQDKRKYEAMYNSDKQMDSDKKKRASQDELIQFMRIVDKIRSSVRAG